jgi:chemotaxis protein methyltransferase CheR
VILERATCLRTLSEASGIELTAYRAAHIADCIRRSQQRDGLSGCEELASSIRTSNAARTAFRRLVAVSVTSLFRDQEQFDLLERDLLPELLSERRRVSVWSAGCADGSELYSVATVLSRVGALHQSFLLGSDLLEENVVVARRGVYGAEVARPEIRARLRWEQRDLVRDGAPRGAFRLIFCRNVAIYLTPPAKQRLHEMLVSSLATRGVLLLGRSERLADPAALGMERVIPHVYRRIR